MCYDRAPRHRLALTFVLSALWHGVFPGYYFTFITAIPITIAARAVSARRHETGCGPKYLGLTQNALKGVLFTPALFPVCAPDTEVCPPLLPQLQRPEAGLRPADVGGHPADHLLHRHAVPASFSGADFHLLQVCEPLRAAQLSRGEQHHHSLVDV